MISELNLAKLITVIGFLETKELFTETKSKQEFTQTVLKVMGKSPLEPSINSFFNHLYDLHSKTDNPDYVYFNEKGDEFSKLKKEASKSIKPGSKGDDIRMALFPFTPITSAPSLPKPKHGWLNLFRKIIDMLDDEFSGKL